MMQEKKEAFLREPFWYCNTGYHLLHHLQFDPAINAFNMSVKTNPPGTKKTLLGRLITRCKKMDTTGAMADIIELLSINPDDLELLQQRALATYLCCDFEDAFIQNTHGAPKRKVPPVFQEGIIQCRETIENCVGECAGHPLRDFYNVIKKLEAKKRLERQMKFMPCWKRIGIIKSRSKRNRRRSSLSVEPITPQKQDNKIVEVLAKSFLKGHMTQVHHISEEVIEQLNAYEQKHNEPIFRFQQKEPKPIQARTTNIQKVMTEKYIERLCYDQAFLRMIVFDPRRMCPNKKGSKQIEHFARYGYNMLVKLEEILRTRRPLYSIRYREAKLTEAILKKQREYLIKQQIITLLEVNHLIISLRVARQNYNLVTCMEIADRAKTYMDGKTTILLPKKRFFLQIVYNIIGLAFLDTKRTNEQYERAEQIRRIQYILGIPISREPSKDSVVRAIKPPAIDNKKMIQVTEIRLKKAQTPCEKAWLFFDLARLYCDSKKYELAKYYAKRSVVEANEVEDVVWALNGLLMLVKIHVLQHNRNEAKIELYTALEKARILNHTSLITFIKKGIVLVERIDFEGSMPVSKVIQQREQAILNLMPTSKTKDDINILFKSMSTLPPNRRLSIMPGIKLESISQVKKNERLSAFPHKEAEEEPLKINLKTAAFLDLMEMFN